jgi:hypothetical protein
MPATRLTSPLYGAIHAPMMVMAVPVPRPTVASANGSAQQVATPNAAVNAPAVTAYAVWRRRAGVFTT